MMHSFKKLGILFLSLVLILAGTSNLKNYSGDISWWDMPTGSIFMPLLWLLLIAVGILAAARYVRMEFSKN
ncbi:MAG TPA: hypothetical protein VJH71_01015 [Candidatus Paceibacterota bacterium]